jgi:hypothetical protein
MEKIAAEVVKGGIEGLRVARTLAKPRKDSPQWKAMQRRARERDAAAAAAGAAAAAAAAAAGAAGD